MAQGIRNPLHLGIADRLRRERKARGLAVSALAVEAGLSHETARQIEAGRIPRLDVVAALAGVLQLSPAWLAYAKPREAARRADAATRGGGGASHEGVGERLRSAREDAGLSAKALGRQSGTSDTAVRTIESGQVVPGADTVERLADALGVSARWLGFGED